MHLKGFGLTCLCLTGLLCFGVPTAGQERAAELDELEAKLLGVIRSTNADKLTTARYLIDEIEKQTSELTGEESWPHRLLIANVRAELGVLDAAEVPIARKLLEALIDEIPAGEPDRLDALYALFTARAHQGESPVEVIASLLNELTIARKDEPLLFEQRQFAVIRVVYEQALSKVVAAEEYRAAAEQLELELKELSGRLQEREVLPGIAQLLQFGVVAFAEMRSDDARLESALTALQPAVESEEVGEMWRALYWNKWFEQHIRRRRYAEAFEASHRMLQSAVLVGSGEVYAIAQSQLGYLSLRMGDYAAAKRILSSDFLRQFYAQTDDVTKICTWKVNLAKALEGEAALFPSRALLEEAEQAAAASNGNKDLQFLVHNNLGLNYYLGGEFEKAAQLLTDNFLQQSQATASEISLAESRVNLGWVALARGEAAAALEQFSTAAEMVRKAAGKKHPRFSEALSCAARAATSLGNRARALSMIQEAEALSFTNTVEHLQTSWSAQDRLTIVQEARVHPESVAWPGVFDTFLELAPHLNISPEQQHRVVMRWKGMLDAFEKRDRVAVPQETRDAEAKLHAALREAYFRRVPLAQRSRVQNEIRSLEDELRRIRRILRPAQADEAVNGSGALITDATEPQEPTSSPQIQLRPGEVLLDIIQVRKYRTPTPTTFGAESEFLGFLTLPDGSCHRFSLGRGDQLEALVEQWRQAIIDESPDERQLAQQVAKAVQQPILQLMPQFERLIVRGDGVTYLLPWCALPGVERKTFWIENVVVELVRGLDRQKDNDRIADGEHERTAVGGQTGLLLVGNVDYGKTDSQWEKLPNTVEEIRAVRSLFSQRFPDGKIVQLENVEACEAELIEHMPNKPFIHLATHGYFLRRESSDAFSITGATSLLNSGIVVAAPQEEDSHFDQYLSAAEIVPLDLSATELVMLSACETGLGKFRAGQGIEGLVTSFQNAGARRVISSLWKVHDHPTAIISQRLYTHLWAEPADSYASALRRAQLDLINSSDAELKSPVAWAGFVISSTTLD